VQQNILFAIAQLADEKVRIQDEAWAFNGKLLKVNLCVDIFHAQNYNLYQKLQVQLVHEITYSLKNNTIFRQLQTPDNKVFRSYNRAGTPYLRILTH
jgi:hypothetical protein